MKVRVTHHEGEGGFRGAGDASRDWSINQAGASGTAAMTGACILVQSGGRHSCGHLPGCRGVDGGGVYQQGCPHSSCTILHHLQDAAAGIVERTCLPDRVWNWCMFTSRITGGRHE